MAVKALELDTYLDAFTRFAKDSASTPSWLRELRERGFARFCSVGFPTTRDEDWRFTNVRALAQLPLQLAPERDANIDASTVAEWSIASAVEGAAIRLVFIDGHFAPALSAMRDLPEGVTAAGLGDAILRYPEVAVHLGRYLDIDRDPFCALNTAFAADGGYVHVRRGAVLRQPIHLLFVSVASKAPSMTHPRNLIVVEDQAEVSIVEEYISLGSSTPAFSNAVTELIAGGNSSVEHTMIERENLAANNFSTLRIEQARNANVVSHSLLLGGALVRNNVHPRLAGEGGECLINGLFIGGGNQHLDNYMLVEHASPRCASRQFYNGILDGRAHGVFHGRIVVQKDAQKTDAKQTNRNLLLNDDAQIDTKPQLEIYADDVKCTHGATIGQIDEEALFYLRSRGLGEPDARQLLLRAFAGECLDRIRNNAARSYADSAVEQRLALLFHPASDANGHAKVDRGRNWREIE